jgi:hypothetical protein
MIPTIDILTQEITEQTYPSRTYRIVINKDNSTAATDRIDGFADDLESVKQAVYLILSTERYQHLLYSWDYGVELMDLIGKPMPYVMSEVPRRIKDALTQDNRIKDVIDFEFQVNKHKLHTTFKVVTDIGDISTELEVDV